MHPSEPGAQLEIAGGTVRCAGRWTVSGIGRVQRRLAALPRRAEPELLVDGKDIAAMDTAGAYLLRRTVETLRQRGHAVRVELRPDHEQLLRLVEATGTSGPPARPPRYGFLERAGRQSVAAAQQTYGMLAFIGENAMIASRGVPRPWRIRWRSILTNVRTGGFDALPIVGLLSFLLGIVIAYQGAAQLQRYGAAIFVADLVGFAMLRELSPLLTAIIVAGRSGSAFAAQIGTMKVTEEIDALRTVGIVPSELLVLPKIAALVIALPLLSVYADVLGVLGGMVMAQRQLSVGYGDFLARFVQAIALGDYLVGIGKAPVFAAIIAVVGCYQGFQVGGDAESVGHRTTVSVVHSVFLVIVADALFSIVFSVLRI